MVRGSIQKIQNPQIGIYSVRFRDSKGVFTKALSKTRIFQYVTKDRSLSRKFIIPKELKTIYEKKLFIYLVLGKIINANESRKEKSENRKGREYFKQKPEELLSISIEDLEILKREFPEVFGEEDNNYYSRLTVKELQQRILRANELERKYGTRIYSVGFAARTDGRSNTNGNDDPSSWIDHQKEMGFIIDKTKYETRKRKNKRTGKITEYKVKVNSPYGNGSIMFQFARQIRKIFMMNREVLLNKKDKKHKFLALKLSIITDIAIHSDLMMSDQEFIIPTQIGNKGYKTRVEGIVWGMAKEAFRMINDDFPFDDMPKGGLTSNDIHTKVRFTPGFTKQFQMFVSLVVVPAKDNSAFEKINAKTGYYKRRNRNRFAGI